MIPDLEAGSTVIAGRISATEHLGCLGRVYWKRLKSAAANTPTESSTAASEHGVAACCSCGHLPH